MSRTSPPMALLALHGHSGTEIAEASGRSLTNISHLFTGRLRWNKDVEKAILTVTNNPTLVTEIRGMARQARLDKRTQQPQEAR